MQKKKKKAIIIMNKSQIPYLWTKNTKIKISDLGKKINKEE